MGASLPLRECLYKHTYVGAVGSVRIDYSDESINGPGFMGILLPAIHSIPSR